MTIRFAPAWGGKNLSIRRALCRSAPLSAVNDNCLAAASPAIASKAAAAYSAPNGPSATSPAQDHGLLTEALRHFASHGLSAAAHACALAEAAHAIGDEDTRSRWIAICRHFDRRMAEALDRAMASAC